MGTITISLEEYRNLLKMQARVEAFADYVNAEQFSVSRKACAIMLGFELVEKEENDRKSNVD